MKKSKIFLGLLIAIIACVCLTNASCSAKKQSSADKTQSTQTDTTQTAVNTDDINNRIAFGKKYYSLGYLGYTENEYYTFNEDGSATYDHIMKENDKITYHQILHFVWKYRGDGECVMMHNGTEMVKGTQDDAFGINRVMHVSPDVIYWSTSSDNVYFIREDLTEQIPNYAKLISTN